MSELTQKQMFEQVVRAAIKGGWEPLRNPNRRNPRLLQISQELVVFIEYDYDSASRIENPVKQAYITYSLPDLIADAGFIAVFGDREVCIFCGSDISRWNDHRRCIKLECKNSTGSGFGCYYLPASRYHMHKAMDIIYDDGDAVKYLWENLPKP